MAFSRNHALVMVTPPDPAYENTSTNWNEPHVLSGAVSGGIPYFDSATSENTSALLAANAIVLGGGAGAAPLTSAKLSESATAGGGLIIAAGTATTDVAALSLTRTNNNSAVGTTVPWVDWVFTDTTSNAAALAFQIRGGAAGTTNLFKVSKASIVTFSQWEPIDGLTGYGFAYKTGTQVNGPGTGFVIFPAANNGLIELTSTGGLTFSSTTAVNGIKDTSVSRSAAGEVAIGTGAQGSAAGTVSAAAYKVGGAAGVSGTGTNVTCVNGIVTAIS